MSSCFGFHLSSGVIFRFLHLWGGARQACSRLGATISICFFPKSWLQNVLQNGGSQLGPTRLQICFLLLLLLLPFSFPFFLFLSFPFLFFRMGGFLKLCF